MRQEERPQFWQVNEEIMGKISEKTRKSKKSKGAVTIMNKIIDEVQLAESSE